MTYDKDNLEASPFNLILILGGFLLSRRYLAAGKKVIAVINVYVIPIARRIPNCRIGSILAVKNDINAMAVVSQARNMAVPISFTDRFIASTDVFPFVSSA